MIQEALFYTLMFLIPVTMLWPILVRQWHRLRNGYDPLESPDLKLWHRMFCVLFAFIFLVGPESFQIASQASVQYSDISTLGWGKGGRTITYTYDDNGSQISKVTTEGQTAIETVTYEYNLQNRLQKVTTDHEDGTVDFAEYRYDPSGIRVWTHTWTEISSTPQDEQTVLYLVDPDNPTGYAQVLEETTYAGADPDPAVDTPLRRVIYTIGDDVLAQTPAADISGTWTLYDTEYLLYDGHGSTRHLINHTYTADENGVPYVRNSYSYDGYGVMLGDGPDAAKSAAANGTNLLYCGEQYDSNLDQYYLRARYYNPNNGLFNRVDPFSGNLQDPQSLHKYLYCHANPINGVDPQGESMLLNLTKTTAIMGLIAAIIYTTVGIVLDISRGDSSAWEIVRNAIVTFGLTFTAFVCPIFMIILLAVFTASLLDRIASGEMKKRDWIELGVFVVVSLVLLIIFRKAGFLKEGSSGASKGGHHSIIPRGGTGRLSIGGFFKNQWGRYIPKFIRESSANVIKKGATKAEYLLWHFRVDPDFFGIKGWSPPAGVAKYGVISRMWHGSPAWLQNTGLYLVFTNLSLYIVGAVKVEEAANDSVEPEYIDPGHPAAKAIQEEE